MTWIMWHKQAGQLSKATFTEEEARNILTLYSIHSKGIVVARNAAGDEIHEHNGPIHVAKVTTDDMEN